MWKWWNPEPLALARPTFISLCDIPLQTQHELTAKGQTSLGTRVLLELLVGSGTSVSSPNWRVEMPSTLECGLWGKTSLEKSWTQWGHRALCKNYFCQPTGCKWCLTKQRGEHTMRFPSYILELGNCKKGWQHFRNRKWNLPGLRINNCSAWIFLGWQCSHSKQIFFLLWNKEMCSQLECINHWSFQISLDLQHKTMCCY